MSAMKYSSKTIISFNIKSSLLAYLPIMMVVIFTVFLFSPIFAAEEQLGNNNNSVTQQLGVKSPATDLWRAVRQREFKGSEGMSSSSQVKSMGSTEFINIKGQEWRNFRMGQLVPYAAYLLGAVLLILALFRLIRGKIKIKSGRSGKKILRFSGWQRFVHWSVAILFVILGITGLLLTFGKSGLIPIIGNESFGFIAGIGKVIHDYLGPVFGIMLTIMLFTFIKGNFGNWTDIKWFFKGGGMFGSHASAGRYNGGEKAWFWMAILAGAVIVISGVVLDFPYFNQTRDDLQLSHLVHAIAAIILLAASFGHIFMGTVAMEGAYEAMRTGYCDENWAKEHHDLWYADLVKQGIIGGTSSGSLGNVRIAMPEADNLTGTASGVSSGSLGDVKKVATSTIAKPKEPSSSQEDNLKKIEGVGPKVEEVLRSAGISSFSQLSNSSPESLKAILTEAGSLYKMHDPSTWPQQAELAAKGLWDDLSELQDRLLDG